MTNDPLRAARAVLYGCGAGLIVWAIVIGLILAAR